MLLTSLCSILQSSGIDTTMNILIILAVIGIAIADTSDVTDTEMTTQDSENDSAFASSSEERRPIRPVSPKSIRELIFTITSTPETNVTTPVTRPYNKPVFKIVQKAVKMKHKSYWKTRRPSLMKRVKFTVNPESFNKHRHTEKAKNRTDKGNRKNYEDEQFRKTMRSNRDDSSEEEEEEEKEKEKRKETKHVNKLIRRFHKLRFKINRENSEKARNRESVKLNMHTDVDAVKAEANEFATHENEDRQEFIFVTPRKEESQAKVAEDSDESGETTTMALENDSKFRRKRSINVIEEENIATTVSGFKFTGKVNSLNNIVFRNINT